MRAQVALRPSLKRKKAAQSGLLAGTFEVFMSQSCHNCPEVVQALADKNPASAL